MTTTIDAADLTVTITETITINGQSLGGSNVQSFQSANDPADPITSVYKRIVPVPLTKITLITNTASAVGGSTFDEDLVKYVRVTNKDDTNYVDLVVANSEGDEFCLRLKAGTSFILWDQNDMLNADNAGVTPGAGMEGVASIEAIADTAVCDVEVFVAST